MNQLKNGTLFVVIATFITVVLLLLTGRDQVHQPDNQIVKEEMPEKTLPVVAKEKTDTVAVVSKDQTKDTNQEIKVVTLETAAAKAPEGLFKNSSEDADKSEPKTMESKAVESSTPEPEVLAQNLSQPIWMNQKLGEFKSLKENEMVLNVIPTNPSGLQGNNPKEVVTNNSDRFVPNNMPADYNYQEMPMYNGGYYVAPMPSYLMSSALPKGSSLKNEK